MVRSVKTVVRFLALVRFARVAGLLGKTTVKRSSDFKGRNAPIVITPDLGTFAFTVFAATVRIDLLRTFFFAFVVDRWVEVFDLLWAKLSVGTETTMSL